MTIIITEILVINKALCFIVMNHKGTRIMELFGLDRFINEFTINTDESVAS